MWSSPIWRVVLTWCLVCRSVLGVTTQGELDEGGEGQEEGRGRVTGHRLRPSPQLGPPVPYLQPLEFFNPKKRQPITTRPSFGTVSVSPLALPFSSPNEKISNVNPTYAYPAPSLLFNALPSRSSLVLNSLPSRPSLAPPSHLQSVEWAGVGDLPSKLPQPPPLKLPKWTPDNTPVKQKHWDTILQAIGANEGLTPPTPPPILDIPTLTSVTIIKNDWLPTNMSSLAMLFNVTVPTNDTTTKQKPSKKSDVLVSLTQTQTVANKKPQHEYREVYLAEDGFNPLEVYLPEHVRSQIQQNSHESLTHTQFRETDNTPIHRLDTTFTLTSSTEAPEYIPWPVGQATSLTLDTDLRDLTKPKVERDDTVVTNSGEQYNTRITNYKGQTDNTWPSLAKGTRYLSINEDPWTDISAEYFPGESPKILENSFLHFNPSKSTTKPHYISWPMNSNTDSILPQNQHYGISEKVDIGGFIPGSVQHRSPMVTHGQIVSSALQNSDSRDTLPIIVVKGSMGVGAPSSLIQAQERDFVKDENTRLDDLIPEEAITVTTKDKKVPDKDIVYNQPWLHAIVQNDLKNWGYPYDKNALQNLPPGYENSTLPPPPNYYKTKADQTNLNDNNNKFLSDLSQITNPKREAQSSSHKQRYEAQFPSPKTKNGQHFAVVQASHMPGETPVMIKNVHVIAPKPDHLPPVPLFRPAEKKTLTNSPYLVSGKLARGTDLNKDDSPILVVPYPDSTSPSNIRDRTSSLYPAIVPLKPASRKEDSNFNPITDILRITSATKSPRRQGSATHRQTELMMHLTPPPEPSLLAQLRELLPIQFPGFGPPKGEDVVIMQRDPAKGITVAELSNDLGDTLKIPQTTPKFSQPTRPPPQSFRSPQSSPPQFRPQQTPPQQTPAQTRPPHTRPPQPALPPALPRPPQNRPPPQSQPQNRPTRHQSQPLQSQNRPPQPLNQHPQPQNIPLQPQTRPPQHQTRPPQHQNRPLQSQTRPPQTQNRPSQPQTKPPQTQNRPLQSHIQPPQTQFRPPAPPQHNNNQQNRQPQQSNERPEQFTRTPHQSQGASQELIRPPREHSRPEQPFNEPPQHINQPSPTPQTFNQPKPAPQFNTPSQLNQQQPPQLNHPPQPQFNEPPQHLNQPSPPTHNKPSPLFTGPQQFFKSSPPLNQPPTTSNRPQEFNRPTQPTQQLHRPTQPTQQFNQLTQPITPPQHNRPIQPHQQTRPIQQFNRPPQQTIPPQPQDFRPPQPQEFKPSHQPQKIRPPQPQEFRPPHQPQEFRPPQPSRPNFNGPIQQNSPQHTNPQKQPSQPFKPHNQPSQPFQPQNRPPRHPQPFQSRPIPQHRPQSRPQSPNFNNFQPPQTVFFSDFQPSQSQQLSVLPPVNTHDKRNTNAVATTTNTTPTYNTTTPAPGPVFIPWPNSQPGLSNLKRPSPNFPNIMQPTLPNMDFLNPINLFRSRESIPSQEESDSSFSFFPSFLSNDDNEYSSSDIEKKFENPPSLHLSPPLPRADSIQQNKLANSLFNILPKNERGMDFLKSLITPLQNNQMFNFKPHLQPIMNTDANGQRQNNPNRPHNKLQTQPSPIQPNTPSSILQAPSQIHPNTLNNNLHAHQTGKETRESSNINASQGNNQLPNHLQHQENLNNLQQPNQNQQSQTNQGTGGSSNNSPNNLSIDSSSTPALYLSSELPSETRSRVEKINPLTNPARPDNHNSPTTNHFNSPELIKFTLDDVVYPSDPTYLHPNNHKKTNINKLVPGIDKPSIRFEEDMDLSPSEDMVSVAEFVPSTKPTQPPTIIMERITFTTQGTTPPSTTPAPKPPQNNLTMTSTFSMGNGNKNPAKTLTSNTHNTQQNIPVLKHNIQTKAQPQPTTYRPTTAKPITKIKTSPFFTLNWRATKPVDLSADNAPPIEKSKEGNWKINKTNSPQQVPRITIIEATPMPKAGEVYPTVKHFRTFVSSFPYGNSDSNNHHITTTVPFTTATTAKSYTTPTPYTKSIPTGPHNANIHHTKANINQKATSTPYTKSSLTPPPYINSHTTPIPYTKPNTTPIPYTKPNTPPTQYTKPSTLTPNTRSTSKHTIPHSPFTTPAPRATTPRSYPKLKWSTTSGAGQNTSPPRVRPVTRNIPPGMMKKRNRQDVMMPGRWNHRTIVRPPKVNLGPGVNETRLDESNNEQRKGNTRQKLRYNSPPRKVQQVNRPTPTPTLMPDNLVTEHMATSTTNRMTQTHPSNVPMPSIVESREIPESYQNALLQESQTVLNMREPEGNERKAADKGNNENGAESQEIILTDSNQNTTSITKDVSFRLIKPPRYSSIQRLRNIMANNRKTSTTTKPPQTPTIPATTQRPATENPRVTTLSLGVSKQPVEVNVKSFNSYRDQLANRRRNRHKLTTTTTTLAPTTTRPRQYTTFTKQPAIRSGFTKQPAIRSGFTKQPAIRSGFTKQPAIRSDFTKQPASRSSFTNISPTIPSDFTDTSTGLGEGGSDTDIRGWRQPIQETLLQDHPEMLELYGWEPTKLTSNGQNNQDPTGSEEHDDQYLSDSNQPYQSQSNTNQQYQSQSNTNQQYKSQSNTNQPYQSQSNTNQQYQSESNTNIQYKSPNRQYQSPSNPNRQYQSLPNSNTHVNLFSAASSLHPVTLMPIRIPNFVFGPRSSSSTSPTTRIGTVSVSPQYATVDRNAGKKVRPEHQPGNRVSDPLRKKHRTRRHLDVPTEPLKDQEHLPIPIKQKYIEERNIQVHFPTEQHKHTHNPVRSKRDLIISPNPDLLPQRQYQDTRPLRRQLTPITGMLRNIANPVRQLPFLISFPLIKYKFIYEIFFSDWMHYPEDDVYKTEKYAVPVPLETSIVQVEAPL